MRLYSISCGSRSGNAGDECSKEILERLFGLGIEIVTDKKEIRTTDLIAAGSLAHDIPKDYRGAIWGAGVMHHSHRIKTPHAKVLAVRGRLTRDRWPEAADALLGDPGILVRDAFPDAACVKKRYAVGVIPHYVHGDDGRVMQFLRRNRGDTTSIDICGRVEDVLYQIGRCERVLSSSLHGIIFAHSIGVPVEWIYLSDKVAGGHFKFKDYYSAFGLLAVPAKFDGDMSVSEIFKRCPQIPEIEETKHGLRSTLNNWLKGGRSETGNN